MIGWGRNRISIGRRCLMAAFLLAGALHLVGGCAARKTLPGFRASGDGLKQRVGMAAFTGHPGPDRGGEFRDTLAGFLAACPRIVLLKPGAPGFPAFLGRPPRLSGGGVDNLALAMSGRSIGLNAVIVAELGSSRIIEKGHWLLRSWRTHARLQVNATVRVFDMETAAKLFEQNFTHEVRVSRYDAGDPQSQKPEELPEFREAVARLVEGVGKRVCAEIGKRPWRGFVTHAGGDRLIVSAGEPIGLKMGDDLEIFSGGTVIEGAGGQRFIAPGNKTGEARITAVHSDRIEAVPVSGKGADAGSIVRLKR